MGVAQRPDGYVFVPTCLEKCQTVYSGIGYRPWVSRKYGQSAHDCMRCHLVRVYPHVTNDVYRVLTTFFFCSGHRCGAPEAWPRLSARVGGIGYNLEGENREHTGELGTFI